MNEGTVSRGVALRPRPTEVQPCFLGSNIYIIWNFFIFLKCHVCVPISVTILLFLYIFKCHVCISISVTKKKQRLYSSTLIVDEEYTLSHDH